jgi:hypothetical protein
MLDDAFLLLFGFLLFLPALTTTGRHHFIRNFLLLLRGRSHSRVKFLLDFLNFCSVVFLVNVLVLIVLVSSLSNRSRISVIVSSFLQEAFLFQELEIGKHLRRGPSWTDDVWLMYRIQHGHLS